MNILLLCTGNLCRSPMAEGLLRTCLPAHELFSAGLSAPQGEPADPLAMALMRQMDIDISAHRARNVAVWMMREADLVLTMDSEQTQIALQRYSFAAGKLERLGEMHDIDIPDPYRRGLGAFRQSLNLIRQAVRSRLPDLQQRETFALR
jgi:protein-tyrosine phosphatase